MRLFSKDSFIKKVKKRAADKGEGLLAAGRDVAKGIALGYLLYYGLSILVIIGLLAVVGFTDLVGGPFVVAQVVLFLLVGTLVLATVGIAWIWHRVKQSLHNLEKMGRKESDVTDTTILKTRNIDKNTHE